MSIPYADLERMYDGRIPAEELARCADLRPNWAGPMTRSEIAAELEALAEIAKQFGSRLNRLFERTPADIRPRLDATAPLSFAELEFAAAAMAAAADIENGD